MDWQKKLVTADAVIDRIRPGMSVFLSTGTAEPRTLVKHLMMTRSANLQDLELIQIVSFADAISNRYKELFKRKSITSYACGTADLLRWLDQNPEVEFQPVEKVFDPLAIGRNPCFMAIVSEARYLVDADGQWAEIAFIVDEAYQKIGICTYMFKLLIKLAKERGLKGFWADVLLSNSAMMKVFYSGGQTVLKEMESGVYHVTIPFEPPA